MNGRLSARVVIIALIAGAISGAIAGAVILGAVGWFSEGSGLAGAEPRWMYLGLYIGARLGLLFGATLGLVIGLLMIAYRQLR